MDVGGANSERNTTRYASTGLVPSMVHRRHRIDGENGISKGSAGNKWLIESNLYRHIWRSMKISKDLTDETVLEELGGRLSAARIERRRTQSALAVQAGVSKQTIERMQSGEVATHLP